mmetsp:Transcript_13798/g.19945  ORF Transcript_13798/g.19945 Transcript_13798/m.19945 type:complete len:108 (-) Transcript_13798:1200-1523(-)
MPFKPALLGFLAYLVESVVVIYILQILIHSPDACRKVGNGVLLSDGVEAHLDIEAGLAVDNFGAVHQTPYLGGRTARIQGGAIATIGIVSAGESRLEADPVDFLLAV